MKIQTYRVQGHPRSSKVSDLGVNGKPICHHFLLVIVCALCNYLSCIACRNVYYLLAVLGEYLIYWGHEFDLSWSRQVTGLTSSVTWPGDHSIPRWPFPIGGPLEPSSSLTVSEIFNGECDAMLDMTLIRPLKSKQRSRCTEIQKYTHVTWRHLASLITVNTCASTYLLLQYCSRILTKVSLYTLTNRLDDFRCTASEKMKKCWCV